MMAKDMEANSITIKVMEVDSIKIKVIINFSLKWIFLVFMVT